MIINLKTVVPDKLVCPEGKRRVEHCDKNLPIPYTERRARTNHIPVPGPVRHGRICKCNVKEMKIILDLTLPQIALMAMDEECESKDLFERECWNPLSHAEKIGIGNCIVCLVAHGLLPLENMGASPKSANHVVYRKL